MRFASNTRRKPNRRSTAARRAASQRQARRRRRTQRQRKFASAVHSLETALRRGVRWLPRVPWRRVWGGLRAPGFSGFVPSKLLSLALLAAVIGLLYWMQESESFFVYREDVHFVGANYLTDDELYAYCDVESWSILWLDPALIRDQVRAHPYVADAQVTVRWPAQVTVAVVEVEPVALWATEAQEYWLLEDGTALPSRRPFVSPRVRIVDALAASRAPQADGHLAIRPRVLESALTLSQRLPGLDEFWYNEGYGLNFGLPGTKTWVHWGDGRRFDEKWRALQAAQPQIQAHRDEDRTFNVTAPNRPFFRNYAATPAGR